MAKYYGEGSGDAYTFITRLNFGFYLDLDNKGSINLLLKLEPALLMSVISGCTLSLVIRNPNLAYRTCTLYMWDDPYHPAFINASSFGEEDPTMPGFDAWAIALGKKSSQISVSFFNHNNHNFFNTDFEITCDSLMFDSWLYQVYNNLEFKNETLKPVANIWLPETEIKGFEIFIKNVNNESTPKIIFLAPEYKEGAKEHPLTQKPYFDYKDFLQDGKHGTFQEMTINAKLEVLFEPKNQLFVSPKYANGLEFTDFILVDSNAVMLIESKFIISSKSTRRHSNISKAIKQLNRAEIALKKKTAIFLDAILQDKVDNVKVVLKVCLVNDRVRFDNAYALQLAKQFEKSELPIFISVTDFSNLLTGLNLKNPNWISFNLFSNLITYYLKYLQNNTPLCIFGNFDIEGLSWDELNEMGKSRSCEINNLE
jgi:hypothetical protein